MYYIYLFHESLMLPFLEVLLQTWREVLSLKEEEGKQKRQRERKVRFFFKQPIFHRRLRSFSKGIWLRDPQNHPMRGALLSPSGREMVHRKRSKEHV